MRVPRLHAPVPLRPRETVDLDATAARHVRNVLRLREGAAVVLFDGAGSAHDATLTRLTRDRVTVEVGASRVEDMESPLRVTVALGVSRGERMDFALQKAVEGLCDHHRSMLCAGQGNPHQQQHCGSWLHQ